VLAALIVAGYVLGKMPLAFTTAVGGIPPRRLAVDLLHQRLRKRRRARASHGE